MTADGRRLYVGGLPYSVDETELKELCDKYGRIEDGKSSMNLGPLNICKCKMASNKRRVFSSVLYRFFEPARRNTEFFYNYLVLMHAIIISMFGLVSHG